MKKFLVLLSLLLIVISSCTKKEPSLILEKDTPAFLLAQEITQKNPYLDPVKNNALIKTKHFNIATGDVFNAIHNNFGNRARQLSSFDETRIKSIVSQHAKQLTEIKLLLNTAERFQIEVTEEEVDSLIDARYIRNGGKDRFEGWLQSNEIKYETVRNDTKNGLIIQKYIEKSLAKDLAVTEEELLEMYNQDKYASVRHILLKTQGVSDSTKNQIYKKMDSLLVRAKKGEDFSALANEYSEDPGSSNKGGLYENITRGQMVKPFEDASFNIPVGEISDIVETTYGYHIIKVIDRKKDERSFEEIKNEIETKLKNKKRNEAYENHIKKLKSKAKYKEIEY
ncbi:peptidylprolyl isomerase [bacterium]|nr:peptidylprolyl isomerase [bacterium]